MNKIRFFFKTITLLLFWACDFHGQELKSVQEYPLAVLEASGITAHNNQLYIVSDNNGTIYKTNLTGVVLGTIETKFKDLEGIGFDSLKNEFVVVDEQKRRLARIDLQGNVISELKIGRKQKSNNSGLEGVCFNSNNQHYYVINEKKPKEILEINKNGKVKNVVPISFGKDLSGCAIDKNGMLWLVSDESRKIYKATPKGKLLKKFSITVNKPEGIVLLNDNIYIVSDQMQSLFVYKIPK